MAGDTNENSDEAKKPKQEPPMSIDEKIEIVFCTSTHLLREILFDYSYYLSRVLVGSRGQDLITEGLGSLKSEDSTVELVMLLCSQEWQNALQRQAGTAFMDLVDEGRLLSHSTRERIVITSSEARDIMNERDNFENLKHAQFETQSTRTMIQYTEQYRTYDHFFKAKRKRNATSATNLLEKVSGQGLIRANFTTVDRYGHPKTPQKCIYIALIGYVENSMMKLQSGILS